MFECVTSVCSANGHFLSVWLTRSEPGWEGAGLTAGRSSWLGHLHGQTNRAVRIFSMYATEAITLKDTCTKLYKNKSKSLFTQTPAFPLLSPLTKGSIKANWFFKCHIIQVLYLAETIRCAFLNNHLKCYSLDSFYSCVQLLNICQVFRAPAGPGAWENVGYT